MQYIAGHNNVNKNALQQQTAGCKEACANVAQAHIFSYICMFMSLHKDTMNLNNLVSYHEPQEKDLNQLIEIMNYTEFERLISQKRLRRYLQACDGNTRKAMTLYRYNVELAQSVFGIIGFFEVALRNAINNELTQYLGQEWLKDSCEPGGIFDKSSTHKTKKIIDKAYQKLLNDGLYSHTKLLAEMEFGVWKYMFSPVQYSQTGKCLLHIFPNKPKSSAQAQYNASYVFNELDKINNLRNRIAHHEPICFPTNGGVIYTSYIKNEYNKILTLLQWMGIDSKRFLYGLDHVTRVCDKIDKLKETKTKPTSLTYVRG